MNASNRRSFLGILGLGTVAGPKALEQSLKTSDQSDDSSAFDYDEDCDEESYNIPKKEKSLSYYYDDLKKRIDDLNSTKKNQESVLRNFVRTVSDLDSDLESNKSFSLSARKIMQAYRNMERTIELEEKHYETIINSYVRRVRAQITDKDTFDKMVIAVVTSNVKKSSLSKILSFIGG